MKRSRSTFTERKAVYESNSSITSLPRSSFTVACSSVGRSGLQSSSLRKSSMPGSDRMMKRSTSRSTTW
jgi:hypothetical protein